MKGPNPRLATTVPPIRQATAAGLNALLERRSTRNTELQVLLLKDPGASIALFRNLGEGRHADFRINDLAHALSMIGMEPLRRLIRDLPQSTGRNGAPLGSQAILFGQAAHAACFAAALADHNHTQAAAETATAALLLQPAVLALATLEPESALRAVNAVRDGLSPDIAFGAELGEPLGQANLRLAESWHLPQLVKESWSATPDLSPKARIIRMADELATHLNAGWPPDERQRLLDALAELLLIDPHQAGAWMHREAVEAARHLDGNGYLLPAYSLPALPSTDPGDEDSHHPIPEFGRRKTPSAAQHAAGQDLHGIITSILHRIRSDTGAGRAAFAMLTRDRSRLRTRISHCTDPGDPIATMDLDLRHRHLFGLLLEKPQSVWLHAENLARYTSLVPEEIAALMDPDGNYLMSLFAGNKPLGLLYAGGKALTEAGYRKFRSHCQEAARALAPGNSPQQV